MNPERMAREMATIVEQYYSGDGLTRKRTEEHTVTETKREIYLDMIVKAFPRCQVANWTDVDEYTSYEFHVLLNESVGSLLDDDVKLIEFLGGRRKDLHIYFSYLAEYWHWHVVETTFFDGVWDFKTTYSVPAQFSKNIDNLRAAVNELGYVELNEAEVKQ